MGQLSWQLCQLWWSRRHLRTSQLLPPPLPTMAESPEIPGTRMKDSSLTQRPSKEPRQLSGQSHRRSKLVQVLLQLLNKRGVRRSLAKQEQQFLNKEGLSHNLMENCKRSHLRQPPPQFKERETNISGRESIFLSAKFIRESNPTHYFM